MTGTADLVDAYADLDEARPGYAKAEAYFDGDVDEIFASDKIAKMLAKSNLDELDEINFARIPVTSVTDRLHITAITTGDDDADEVIADLIKRNQLTEELPGLHVRACSQGDAYLMVWPDHDDEGNILGINMFVNSAATVRVIYDEENPLVKKLAIKSWCVGSGKDQLIRADLWYEDRIERWAWQGRHRGKQDKWQPYTADGQEAVLANPYGVIPFFHYRTERPYGRPEHYAAYGAQSLINKLVVSHASNIDFQSLPQRYGLIDPTVDQSGTQTADGDPAFPYDDAADPEDPLNPSQLRNDPGELWLLQGLKGVGQFEAANPDTYLKPFDRYVKAMAQVTSTPFQEFDSTGDAISGEARREARASLTARVQARQRSFGATHSDAFECALQMLGIDDVNVSVRWQPADYRDDTEGWSTVDAKIKAGVPRERALIEAGCPPELVEGWMSALDDDAELQRRVELLTSIGTAVQALGAGVQLGAINEAQVAALLEKVLGAATDLGDSEVNR
ncbi:hypothetical protein [Streptomyces spinosirectus]